jgi:hypothetical protein
MPEGHKDDCGCPVCRSERKAAAKAAAAKEPLIDVKTSPEYKTLLAETEAGLERETRLQTEIKLAQDSLDKADIRAKEMDVIFKRMQKQRNELLRSHAGAVDLLRTTSISHHNVEGHRKGYTQCDNPVCVEAAKLWFTIGEGAGVELAKEDPNLWFEKRERNEAIVANFGDPGELEQGDLEEEPLTTSFDEEEEDEDDIPAPVGHVAQAGELDEIPDSPAFAGKKVRVLHDSGRDRDDPGMPRKAKV